MATTDMNAQIHIKDDNGNVNNIFPATKIANVEGLTAALNAKADTTTVNNQLSGKVDKETGKGLSTNDYTTAEKNKLSGIEAQANKTTVDSALSSSSTNPVQNKVVKAALDEQNSDLVSGLATKADTSAVSSLSSQVSTNTTNIATQTARIDAIAALPSGSTSGDAELIDIRTKANGTTATNAGTAVREQITELSKWNVVEVLSESERKHEDASVDTLDFEFLDYKTCHMEGTANGAVQCYNVYYQTDHLPAGITAGSDYLLHVKGANLCKVDIYYVKSGSQSLTLIYGSVKLSRIITIPSDAVGLLVRFGAQDVTSGTVINETMEFGIFKMPDVLIPLWRDMNVIEEKVDAFLDANSVNENCIYFCGSTGGVPHVSHLPNGSKNSNGWLETHIVKSTDTSISLISQTFYPYQVSDRIYRRICQRGTWGDWTSTTESNYIFQCLDYTPHPYSDANDVDKPCVFFCESTGGVPSVSNLPSGEFNGWLETVLTLASGTAINLKSQVFYPYAHPEKLYRRIINVSGEWSQWAAISSGTQIIEQEISRDTYNNTFNITATPQITTDNHRWLQSVDTETADETGKTDMTPAIMAMLNSTGYCKLSEGIFYVSGNIDMPEGSMLEGCGKKTVIRLLNSVNSGYICRMKKHSTIKNIRFSGAYNNIDISGTNIGGRKGIYAVGNRDGEHPEITPARAEANQISNCWFDNLDSAIYAYNTGGGVHEGYILSDCFIQKCMAGINLDYWTEYNKFTNVMVYDCHYACINNGGNNMFVNCTFHGKEGFIIDGSKPNAAHGSCVGCTFNHIDGNGGVAVKILNAENGFVFTGGQLWYGKIHIENSKGIIFSDTLIGGSPNIETVGSGTVFFNGCLFNATITRSLAGTVKFDNCYMYNGTPVTE